MPRFILPVIVFFLLLPQIRTASAMGEWTPLLLDLAKILVAFVVLRFIFRQFSKRVLRPIARGVKGALGFAFMPKRKRFDIDEDTPERGGHAKQSTGSKYDDTMEFAPIHH